MRGRITNKERVSIWVLASLVLGEVGGKGGDPGDVLGFHRDAVAKRVGDEGMAGEPMGEVDRPLNGYVGVSLACRKREK